VVRQDETGLGGKGGARFPSTHWTLLLSGRADSAAREVAYREIVSAYWKPLYFYVRRKGLDVEAAKDAVQGLLTKLLEKEVLERLDPEKGRLRSFLKTSMDRHLRDDWIRRKRLKRGGGAQHVPMDFEVAESELSETPPNPEEAYNRQWAISVMQRGFRRLTAEYEDGSRTGPFELVKEFFGFGEVSPYRDLAAKYEMTIPQLKSFLHRARGRFRELLLEEITHTVSDSREMDAEYTEILSALQSK